MMLILELIIFSTFMFVNSSHIKEDVRYYVLYKLSKLYSCQYLHLDLTYVFNTLSTPLS
jgi:hypothetical protein